MSEMLQGAIFRTQGVPEVSAEFVHQSRGSFRLLDCREADELIGPLSAIAAIEHVALGGIPEACGEWDPAEALVLVCRSGRRSGRAALELERKGFDNVA